MSTPGTLNYPASLDDAVSLLEAMNDAATTLDGNLTAIAVTMNVLDTSDFPPTGALTVVDRDVDGHEISKEIIYYTGKTTTSFTGLIRGRDGTAPAAHDSGSDVEGRIIARHHTVLAAAIIATETEVDAQVAALTASILALDAAKADVATTLAGYSITDAFTKTESDGRFAAIVHNHDDRYFTETESDARFAATVHVHALADITGLLSGGKIATGLLPALAITDTFVVASQAAMLALTAETGDIAVRSDLKKTFILQGTDPTNLAHWVELQTPTDAVLSVNGQTGVVALTAADVGALTQAAADIRYLAIGGTAALATALGTPRNINGVAFDGTANITIAAAAGTLTGATLAANVLASSLTSVGTIATGVWNGTTIAIANGGTGQTTAANAINALLPSQTGNNGKYLTTDGSVASWATVSASDATKLPLAGGTMTGRITVPFAADRLTTFIGNASYGLNATSADGAICVVQGGTPHIVFVGTQSRSKSNIVLGWADTTDNSTAADTGLGRTSARRAQVNNGTLNTLGDLDVRKLYTSASTTSLSSLNIPHGAAPTSPVNGDVWTTTAGLFIQINGATVGPLS